MNHTRKNDRADLILLLKDLYDVSDRLKLKGLEELGLRAENVAQDMFKKIEDI